MTRIRMFALIAAAFASPVISIEPVWAQSRTEVIAQTGQAAPDGNGTFSYLGSPEINDWGQVAFSSDLIGTSGGTSDDNGIFMFSGGSITQIARKGQAAPDANGIFSNVYNQMLNNSGQVAFSGSLTGTIGGFTDDVGIFRGSGGSITQIVRAGQSALGNGTFWYFGGGDINDSGQVAFSAGLTGTIGGASDSTGIFRGSGGSFTQIVRKGQSAPDSNGTFSSTFSPVLNNGGQAAFIANLTGTSGGSSDNAGIFRGSGGSITQIVRKGQSAPFANGTFSSFYFRSLNDSGQVAFDASLTGTSGGTNDDHGIFRGSGGSITQIVREGQSAPDANGTFSGFGSLLLNNAGQTAFRASLDGTRGGFNDDDGIFRSSGGSITQIVREGQSAPDANGTFSTLGDHQLNDAGQAAFYSILIGNSGGGFEDGIFTGDGIDFFQVVRKGDLVDGFFVNAVSPAFSLNEHGQIAHKVTVEGVTVDGIVELDVIRRWTPDLHWRNSYSSIWDSTGEWTLGLKPAIVHDVFIDPAASLTVTGPAADTTVRSLQIGGGIGLATLSLQNGSNLSATNGITIRSTGTLTGDGIVSGSVENYGTIVADNLTVLQDAITNHNTIRGSGRIDARIINAAGGRIRALGGSEMWLSGEYLFVNGGLVEVNNSELRIDAYVNNIPGTGLISLRNGSLIADAGISNEGSMAATLGSSTIQGDISNTGTIQVSGGAHATFFGDVEQNGVLQIARVGSNVGTAVFLGEFTGSGGFTGGGDLFALGDLRPGNSPASVTFGGNLFLGFSSNTFFELGGLGLGEFDQLRITGDLNLAGDLFVSLIDGHTLGFNQQYLIGDIGGTLLSQFNGLGEGDLVGMFGGHELFISYTAGNGNDIALFTAIPEPGTYWMLCTSALAVMIRRRRSASQIGIGVRRRCEVSIMKT